MNLTHTMCPFTGTGTRVQRTYPVFLTTIFRLYSTANQIAACTSAIERASTPTTGTPPCPHIPVILVFKKHASIVPFRNMYVSKLAISNEPGCDARQLPSYQFVMTSVQFPDGFEGG